jgi:hypothetical protein
VQLRPTGLGGARGAEGVGVEDLAFVIPELFGGSSGSRLPPSSRITPGKDAAGLTYPYRLNAGVTVFLTRRPRVAHSCDAPCPNGEESGQRTKRRQATEEH